MTRDELTTETRRLGGKRALARAMGMDLSTIKAWSHGELKVSVQHAERIRRLIPQLRKPGRPTNPRTISADELKRFIDSAGGVRAAARLIGVTDKAIRNYRDGNCNPPESIAIAMRAALTLSGPDASDAA
jgi:DNA-binding transcriptional regulator YdaS (Cro superfamily)